MQHITEGVWMGRRYIKCHGCGAVANDPAAFRSFAHAHQGCAARMQQAAAPGYGGLGDAIAAGTKAIGIQPCAPCQRRQAMLNRAVPRLFRR